MRSVEHLFPALIFALAGIWVVAQSEWPSGRNLLHHHHDPNALVADVHDRTRVILPDDVYDLWLDPGFQKVDAVCDLLQPFDADLMRRYDVSSRVNLVKNDDAECAEAVVRLFA